MIDPGHPFSRPYADLIATMEDDIRNGVEQPAQARFIFQGSVTAYPLPGEAWAISRVTGMRGGLFTVFQPDTDYALASSRLLWINEAGRPDEGSRLDVEYTYRERPAGLTDFNPGSVIGTLVRAVARELKLLYGQMDEAYRRAFLDQATGVALDNVVALLGVTRHAATTATGRATFFRTTATNTPVVIARGTVIADQSGRRFITMTDAQIPPTADEFWQQQNGVIQVNNRVAGLTGIWPRGADPAATASLATKPTAPRADFGADERTITLADGVRPAGDLLVRYQPKSVTVAIEAQDPGPNGNVNAGSIVVMPRPPVGVNGVTNEQPVEGGQPAEADDQLRERARHALERAGNATTNAIKFAVLGVDGVEGIEVRDHADDEAIPLGEVRVRYSGGDPRAVAEAVERTRAAGILARLDVINKVLIAGTFYLIPDVTVPAGAADTFRSQAIEAIDALQIGDPFSVRRVSALAYKIAGLADVAQAVLTFSKEDPANPGTFITGPVTDPYLTGPAELVRADKANLAATLVTGLKVKATRKSGTDRRIDLQMVDAAGNTISFGSFAIDVAVTLKATLKTAPDQPPERIGSFTRTLTYTNGDTSTLVISAADRAGFRPDDHDPRVKVSLAAAAFPGLRGADTTIDVS